MINTQSLNYIFIPNKKFLLLAAYNNIGNEIR